MYPYQTEFEFGLTVVAQKTEGCPIREGGALTRNGDTHRQKALAFALQPGWTERVFEGAGQISGKKNPKQLMEAWDLKMHKPWW